MHVAAGVHPATGRPFSIAGKAPWRRPTALHPVAAASSDDTAVGVLLAPAYGFIGRPGSPSLVNRRLQLNPFSTLVNGISAAGSAADLRISAAVDRYQWAPTAAAGAGIALGLGLCNPWALLSAGVPSGVQAAIWRAINVDTQGIAWSALAAALGLAPAAYAIRSWLLAQAALAQGMSGALPHLAALQGRPRMARLAQMVAGSRGLTYGLAAARGALVFMAAGALSAGGATACAVAMALAAALALLPELFSAAGALCKERRQQQIGLATGAVAASLALEAAWCLATAAAAAVPGGLLAAAWAPLGAAALAAGSLAALHHLLLQPRLAAFAAAAGDEATVQVRIRLESSSAPFDDSRHTLPGGLCVRVGGALGSGAEQQSSSGFGGGGSGGGALGQRALDAEEAIPGSQWQPLVPIIELALPGALLGEVVSIPFENITSVTMVGGEAGAQQGSAEGAEKVVSAPLYRSRGLCWWQPVSDVAAKFGGRVPEAGEAFLYPVNNEGAWLWTSVRAVGTDHVELDANYGTEGHTLVMEVEVVQITKRRGQEGQEAVAAGGGGGRRA